MILWHPEDGAVRKVSSFLLLNAKSSVIALVNQCHVNKKKMFSVLK